MAGFQEDFLKQPRFILGDCHIANIFRTLPLFQTAQMQRDKNESMSSHHSALQCELQIVHYLLLGTRPIAV